MEQHEQVICTIKKHSNHSSNQDLITQKGRAKSLLQPTMNMASNSLQKKKKKEKLQNFELNRITKY